MKDIPGFEGIYAITKKGKVWSFPRKSSPRGFWMSTWYKKSGYLVTHLRKNKKDTFPSIHRLIALTYIPNPENKPQVNHKNLIRSDNRIKNLEWCTNKENINHSHRMRDLIFRIKLCKSCSSKMKRLL